MTDGRDDFAAALSPDPDDSADWASSVAPAAAPPAEGAGEFEDSDDVRTTEWFSVEEDLAEEEGPEPLPRRDHHVTVVLVGHDGAVWLPAVLTTLARQTRLPNRAVAVDSGSVDGTADLLAASFGEERLVRLADSAGFGAAVTAGLERLGPARTGAIPWVWLLHDDSAPDTHCLEALLDTADDHPTAAVLGPKVLGWHDRRLLLEAGVTVSGAGRRVTGLERREHDQGQHDGVRDVMSVGSAGMLIRRDVWDALEGFDPSLPLFRDDLDLCWRALRRGERVLIATDAVLHHREASAHGRRADDIAPRPSRSDREAAIHVLLAHAPAWAVPFVALRLLVGSLARGIVDLLGKDVPGARDELAAVGAVARRPSRLRASRALIARTTTEPASVARSLRPRLRSQVRHGLEVVGAVATTSGSVEPTGSVSGLDSGPTGEDVDFLDDGSSGLVRRLLWRGSVVLVLVLAAIAVLGARGLWLGDGVLQGGALLPSPEGASDLWQRYTRAWHDVGPGSTTPASPYLALITALAVVLLGKAPAAVTVLLLLAIPLAGWSAYFTLRGLVASRAIRVWAGAAYALLPAMTGAIASGRIGTTIAAIVLPFALRSLVRISSPRGTLRRAGGTALLVAIVLAVAPALWLVLVVAGIAVTVWTLRTRSSRAVLLRLAVALLAPLILLLPWSAYLLTHPTLLLLEPGLVTMSINDPELTPLDVLLLHPGGPGMTPLWLTAGLVIGALLALLRADRRTLVGRFGALAALAGMLGIAQVMVMVVPPGSTVAVRPWPGQATLLLGLGMIAMGAVAVDGLRGRLSGRSFTLATPVALVAAVIAVLAPVLSAVWYVGGLDTALRRAPATAVPAFVAADSESAQAPRTLVLDSDRAGRVTYALVNGPSPLLGDAETSPPAAAFEALDPYVAAMASGRGGDEIEALAGYGVRYILLSQGAPRDIIPVLDGEPGLRRLSSAGGEVLWRVAGTTSRARVVGAEGQTPVGLAPEGRVTADPYLAQALPEGTGDRLLVLGAGVDNNWDAVVVAPDGTRTELTAVPAPGLLSWSKAFAVPAGTPVVEAAFDDSTRSRWLWLQGIVLLVLIVVALPERRRVDPDPDLDDERGPGLDDAIALERIGEAT
jgi:GT2 family glycosyltransferase